MNRTTDMLDLAVHTTVLLEDWCGLVVPSYHLPRIEAELADLSLEGLTKTELSERFHRDPDFRSKILARVAIPETYFFRYFPHYQILREVARRRTAVDPPVRVLSAGCATGEEAWSAAAVLSAELDRGSRSTATGATGFEVLGLDMVDGNLLRAIEGRYSSWSARDGFHGYDRFFRRTGRQWEVSAELRPRVQFEIANLVESGPPPRTFDVVFFRNVALYWQESTLRTVLAGLVETLRPGGLLLVGPNDPIPSSVEGLRRETACGVRVYRRRRPGEDEAVGTPLRPLPVEAPKTARRRARPKASPRARPEPQPRRGRVHESPTPSVLEQVQGLADRGAYEQALALIADDRDASAEQRMWRGILLLNLERPHEALAAFRQCIYLDPANPAFRRWMAATYELLGLGEEAEREYRNLSDLEPK